MSGVAKPPDAASHVQELTSKVSFYIPEERPVGSHVTKPRRAGRPFHPFMDFFVFGSLIDIAVADVKIERCRCESKFAARAAEYHMRRKFNLGRIGGGSAEGALTSHIRVLC